MIIILKYKLDVQCKFCWFKWLKSGSDLLSVVSLISIYGTVLFTTHYPIGYMHFVSSVELVVMVT